MKFSPQKSQISTLRATLFFSEMDAPQPTQSFDNIDKELNSRAAALPEVQRFLAINQSLTEQREMLTTAKDRVTQLTALLAHATTDAADVVSNITLARNDVSQITAEIKTITQLAEEAWVKASYAIETLSNSSKQELLEAEKARIAETEEEIIPQIEKLVDQLVNGQRMKSATMTWIPKAKSIIGPQPSHANEVAPVEPLVETTV